MSKHLESTKHHFDSETTKVLGLLKDDPGGHPHQPYPQSGQGASDEKHLIIRQTNSIAIHDVIVADNGRWYFPKDLLQFRG